MKKNNTKNNKNNTYINLIHEPIINCGFYIIWSNGFLGGFGVQNPDRYNDTNFEMTFVSKNKNINILALQRYLKKLVKNKTTFTINDIYECRCSDVEFWENDSDNPHYQKLFIEIKKIRELRGMDDGK